MTYLSDLMGKAVVDVDGEHLGYLKELIAAVHDEKTHPEIVAISIECPKSVLTVSIACIAVLVAPAISLVGHLSEIIPYNPGLYDLYLIRDVLDKQIIDINGVRVVRVNDLELARVNNRFYIANVDIGNLGLLRRLGLAKWLQSLTHFLGWGRKTPGGIISWHDIELLPGNQPLRLRVTGDKITELHPADLAEIISDLNRVEGGKLLETLDVKTVADTLEEVEPDFQASLIEAMSDEKAADVLQEMSPDEAADLLAELPENRSQELLNLMAHKEAEGLRKLLAYPVDLAGGIMNTEFVAIGPHFTAEQTISVLREAADTAETIFYVYVVEKDNQLMGVFSLRDLILATPNTPVTEFMHQRVLSVNLLDSQEEVAQIVAKYNLLAVPVVDDQNRLQGIVTADDALDKIIPTAWKKRLPRLYR